MKASRAVSYTSAVVLLALAFGPGRATTCHAQASPRELHTSANAKLAQGDFMGAIPDLQQLIELLGQSDKTQIIASLEMVYYNFALAQFFTGQFEPAEKAFLEYLKKYRNGALRSKAAVYIADSLRYRNNLPKALDAYKACLRQYQYTPEFKSDIFSAIARCHLADGNWKDAIDPLFRVYRSAPDFVQRNWAATLLATAFLKERDIDKIYPLVPFILRPNSFASRSVAFNMAALEAGDLLFGEERYREALWVYRLVYPHDLVMVRAEEYLERLQAQAERMRGGITHPRDLMRIQESIGELEAELKAVQEVDNYDLELYSRIAHGYMEFMRYWEAREIFLHLNATADARTAEEALYLAFQCSTQILPWDRAFEIGEDYMSRYPSGEFFDFITISMGQMYARQEKWPKVIEHLTRTLEMSPRHQAAAECMFLIGYASFMEEKFEDAIKWLSRVNAEYPGNEMVDEATYWTGMSYMFNKQFEEGAKEFDRVLEEFPECIFVEDAAFRRAVCDYGLGRYEDTDRRLEAFIAAYPTSRLTGEAFMMRGDVCGTLGRLDDGVRFYQQAMEFDDLNIEFYNHCAFQCARILADNEDYAGLRSHFKHYIEKNREGSNIPQAVYWVGVALWNSGEHTGAMNYYRQAVQRFGKDRNAVGVDMILDEWIGRTKSSTAEESTQAWADLRRALATAIAEKDKPMELRLRRVILYAPDLQPSERQSTINEFASAKNLEFASPAVLQAMLDMAKERNDEAAAVQVAEYLIATFTETDYALDARMVLADFAVKRARKAEARSERDGFYAEAIKHLGVIREVFATSSEAGKALVLLGRIYTDLEDYKEADEAYKSVLGVKAWRDMWPEALYGRGECAFAQKKYEEAGAYFERIYLMYSHYADWTAKAYLRRAECLRKSYLNEKAREVIQEMLANTALAAQPETEEARELLKKLGGS